MTNRPGFTTVELIFVLLLGAIVTGMGVEQFNRVAANRAVTGARDAVVRSAFVARSEAMRSGQVVQLNVLPDSGLVRISDSGGQVLHTVSVDEYGATILGSALSVCYASRGYALAACTSVKGEQEINIHRGADTATAVVLPLGQFRSR